MMRLYVLRESALAASVVSTAATVVTVATWPALVRVLTSRVLASSSAVATVKNGAVYWSAAGGKGTPEALVLARPLSALVKPSCVARGSISNDDGNSIPLVCVSFQVAL